MYLTAQIRFPFDYFSTARSGRPSGRAEWHQRRATICGSWASGISRWSKASLAVEIVPPPLVSAKPARSAFNSIVVDAQRCIAFKSWYVYRELKSEAISSEVSSIQGTELKTISATAEGPSSVSSPLPGKSALASSVRYVRNRLLRFLLLSATILVPCFWHRHIEASDLGSHMYNAWLAQLIAHGQAPGLWIAHQWTNVLFDLLLSGFGSAFGLAVAEKIAVSLCVLVFFWGLFALISAATGRAPWFLTPVMALVSYGYTFEMGLLNYYLALGLSFFCIAILWRGAAWERLAAVPIAGLVAMAHPFGIIWLVCAFSYIAVAEHLPLRYQFVLVLAAAGGIALVHYYFWHRTIFEAELDPFYWFSGADQLILFGGRYEVPERLLIVFAIVSLAVDVVRRRHEAGLGKAYALPVQLYIVIELAVFLFPRGVRFPHHVAIALITERLTSISAAAACCILGVMRPGKWHLAASLAIAGIFFTFLYQDTGTVNRIEDQVERAVGTLRSGQRVLATILPLPDWRILMQHIADRACIGHCFSYGNYEPGSEVFRVRASAGNRYAMDDYEDAVDMEEGDYVVRPEDLPASQVFQCSTTGTDICIRSLEAGEENNRLGVYQEP